MKILQVNNVYNNGSTGKIVHDIHVSLQQRGDQSIVCYGRGERADEPNVYKICGELYSKINNVWSRVTGLMYGGLSLSTNKLISIINRNIFTIKFIRTYIIRTLTTIPARVARSAPASV